MNIVLDLDGTLINDTRARPFLEDFLLFCFNNFSTVSIWTAANSAWSGYVYTNILEPILKNISFKLFKPCQFSYFLTDVDCCSHILNGNPVPIKPLIVLAQLANQKINFNASNTLIVDDIPITFVQNPANGIYLPPFVANDDIFLLILKEYLFHLLGSVAVFGNITTANVIANSFEIPWYKDQGRVLLAQQAANFSAYSNNHDTMDLTWD
jgi:hypothetical protein